MQKVIHLKDGLDVEVEISDQEAREIASSTTVESSIGDLENMLGKVMKPIANAYRDLNRDMSIKSAKVSVGVKIGAEGNFILAKSTAGAHIEIELNLMVAE